MHYYEVIPNRLIRPDKFYFTYEFDKSIDIGAIVSIPIGKKEYIGIVYRTVNKKPEYTTKPIIKTIDNYVVPRQLLELMLWMSEYYQTHPSAVLNSMLPRGVDKTRRVSSKTYPTPVLRDRTNYVLNNDQQMALAEIDNVESGSMMLQGITGSGKTAVYIELAKKEIAAGKSAIILLPEIALTSQILSEFSLHFEDISIIHSTITESERHKVWQKLISAETPQVVIGARSALFAPLKSIGLIVLDESHEPSYKQEQSPKYSSLRVASILGKLHSAKIIYGSATPSVSERYLAIAGKRPIIRLDSKAKKDTLPANIKLIDMREKATHKSHSYFSDALLEAIEKSLAAGKQTLIYHNRRGSRSITLCESCGWSANCPKCFTPMTLHADMHKLKCRICQTSTSVPSSCPVCHEAEIIHKGIGTKQIESDLRKLYPDTSIARFDGDNDKQNTLASRYQELYDGSIDIAIGTQIVAKGLDLPHLETVGVIQAESGLILPDFTSAERTFQLLSQVSGRVGRNENASQLIIQSYKPDHPSIKFGATQDYEAFYDYEIENRKKANFPPFCHILQLICVYKTEQSAILNSKKIMKNLQPICSELNIEILGPTPAFYERQGDTFRWQLILKSKNRANLLNVAKLIPDKNWQIELDPSSLL